MEPITASLTRAVEELLGRASGPMHFRLVMQPILAGFFAVRAGLKDAREGHPPFLATYLARPDERRGLLQSAWKDIGKIFLMAVVLDCVYQLIALRTIHVLQVFIVAVVLAILPYVILRGPVNRLMRGRHTKSPSPPTQR